MHKLKAMACGLGCIVSLIRPHQAAPLVVAPQISNPKQRARYERTQALFQKGPWLSKANSALPTASDLPTYTVALLHQGNRTSVQATRLRDNATLDIAVLATPNVEARNLLCLTAISTDARGRLPKGSPSRKPLGQQSWQSWGSSTYHPNPLSYFLQVQDGPSVIRLTFSPEIRRLTKGRPDPQGRPVWETITQADRLQVEHVARLMLGKLRKLNLTHDTFHPAKPKGD